MDQRHFKATQIANVITPGIGFVLSLLGTVVLIIKAVSYGDGIHQLWLPDKNLLESVMDFSHAEDFRILSLEKEK